MLNFVLPNLLASLLLAGEQPGVVRRDFVFETAPFASCHAATLVETSQGQLLAAWFGGTREGANDVGIWLSRQVAGQWSAPVEVATGVQPDGSRLPCWNPVLCQPAAGPVWLYYKVGRDVPHWWGEARSSADGGLTWSEPRRLPAGILGPIKNKPVPLADGTLVAPSSTEHAGWQVHFERSRDNGQTWVATPPVNDGKAIGAIQPSLLLHPDGKLQAIGRTNRQHLFSTWSQDGGQTWSPLTLLDLPNPNSGIDAVTLRGGRHLLVYNHSATARSPLNVALSSDGRVWRQAVTLEDEPRGEFSYPACIQTRDGLVHLAYTWKRQRIRHVVLDPARLEATAILPSPTVPGVVIDHSPQASGKYIGSPGLAVLPDGRYVASHDFFGPQTTEHQSAETVVFRSDDRGATWAKVATLEGQFWSTLFVHRGALYLLGTNRHHGNAIIRRSTDGGTTWTTPVDAKTGVIRGNGEYHCGPMPVLAHAGRLWRAMERRDPPTGWGITYCAGMLSVPEDADLLDAANWTVSNFLPSQKAWCAGKFGGWLEGNAVATPDGRVLDMLRVETPGCPEQAALVAVSDDGRTTSFDPTTGFVDFPGGAKKFTIRYDAVSRLYWSLASIVAPQHEHAAGPGGIRNTLALTTSPDLRHWSVRCTLLYHPDVAAHGFQYVEWAFDGDDILYACRTAYDDGQGGAHNNHDANYLTFHRITRFRDTTAANSVPFTQLPPVTAVTADLTVTGHGWRLATLAEGQVAFGNRGYVWHDVPTRFSGWQMTQLNGGERAAVQVTAKRDATLYLLTGAPEVVGWTVVPEAVAWYSDTGKTKVAVWSRAVHAGETVELPQTTWTGASALLPPAPQPPAQP